MYLVNWKVRLKELIQNNFADVLVKLLRLLLSFALQLVVKKPLVSWKLWATRVACHCRIWKVFHLRLWEQFVWNITTMNLQVESLKNTGLLLSMSCWSILGMVTVTPVGLAKSNFLTLFLQIPTVTRTL